MTESIGFPISIKLEDFGQKVYDAFGDYPYRVGSSLIDKKNWRDVDIRLILSSEEYKALNLGDPQRGPENPKWTAICYAFSELGKAITGLPIDFQIQERNYANAYFNGPREPIGILPFRKKD